MGVFDPDDLALGDLREAGFERVAGRGVGDAGLDADTDEPVRGCWSRDAEEPRTALPGERSEADRALRAAGDGGAKGSLLPLALALLLCVDTCRLDGLAGAGAAFEVFSLSDSCCSSAADVLLQWPPWS